MKRFVHSLAPLALLVSATIVSAATAPQGVPPSALHGASTTPPPRIVSGELLVKYRSGIRATAVARAERASVRSMVGGTTIKEFDYIGVEHVRLGAGVSVEQAIEQLRQDPRVEYVEPNYLLSLVGIPSDSLFGQQWALRNTGQTHGVPGFPHIGIPDADIDAEQAWDVFTGDPNILIGVIDTGVDYTHPDLVGNIWTNPGEIPGNGIDDDNNDYIDDVHGYDFYNNDGDPMDENAHGTFCAGIIGAVGGNGKGVAGVNWRCKIVALKCGQAGTINTAKLLDAIRYSIQVGVKVTNNSYAGGGGQALLEAVNAAAAAGQLYIAAAGNGVYGVPVDIDADPVFPAGYDSPCIISVAATDDHDTLAPWSNYGLSNVDLSAPGVDVYSTRSGPLVGQDYFEGSGTSFAGPQVAGACALAWGYHPSWTAAQIKDLVLNSVDPKPTLEGRCVTGGRLNLGAMFVSVPPESIPPVPVATTGTSVSATSFRANWNTVSRAISYKLDVALDAGFTSFVTNFRNRTVFGSSLLVTGLAASTTYYIRVRAVAINAAAASGNSNTVTVITGTPPLPPVATAATGVTAMGFAANWNASAGAASYRLDVSTSPAFASYVTGYQDLTVTGTSQPVSGLEAATTHYYRVRAVNAVGTGGNSNVITVTTTAPPPAPVATAATDVTATGFTANWTASSSATGYRLDVSTNLTFTSYVSGYQDLAVTGTSQAVTGLAASTTYYFRVRAANADGASGFSNTITMATSPPEAIQYTAKGTHSVNSDQWVPWTESPPITIAAGAWLIVAVAIDISGSNVQWRDEAFGGTPLTLLASSENGGSLRIYGLYCSTQKTGSVHMGWDDAMAGPPNVVCMTMGQVTGIASGPRDQLAVSGGYSSAATAGPSGMPAADHEFVYAAICHQSSVDPAVTWGSGFAFGQGVADYNEDVHAERAVADGWKVISTAAPQTASCTFASPRTWSMAVVTFREGAIPATPTAIAGSNVTTTGFAANWNAVSGATSYRLDVSNSPTFSTFVPGYDDLAITGTSQAVISLAASTTYYYRVRAANLAGTSENSNTVTVTTSSGQTIQYAARGTHTATNEQGLQMTTSPPITIAAGAWLIVSAAVNLSGGSVHWRDETFGGTPLTLLASSEYEGSLHVYGLYCPTQVTASVTVGWDEELGGQVPNVVSMTMSEVAGLTTAARDQVAIGSGSSGMASAGPTGMPLVDHEFVYAAAGHQFGYEAPVAWGNGFAYGQGVGISNDDVRVERAVVDGWKIISSAAPQTASCTFESSRFWSMAAITFQEESTPPTPIASTATDVLPSGFTANWNAAARATSYRLDIATDSGFNSLVPGYQDLSVTGTSQTVNGLSASATYFYRVRATNPAGTSSSSNTISVTTSSAAPPPAPLAVAATAVVATAFTASWNPAGGATGYRLDVSASPEFTSYVSGYQDLPVSGTSQAVSGLAAATDYHYRVRAVNVGGPSGNSNTISVTTLPAVPVALAATRVAPSGFQANWNVSAGATSCRLDISNDPSFTTYLPGYQDLTVTESFRAVTGLTASTTYYYRLRAVSAAGTSENSNTITTTTLPFEENFDYSGALTANGWTQSGSGTPTISAASPGLSYAGYVGSGVGNAAVIANAAGQDVSRSFASVNSGSVFVAFMLKASNVIGNGAHFLELGQAQGGQQCNFFAKSVTGGYKLGIGKANTGSYASSTCALNTTYLVVMKYTFVPGGSNDEMKLFVNPAVTGVEPTASVTLTSGVDAATALGYLQIRQVSSSQLAGRIDGIRIARNWADAVGAAQQSSQLMARAGAATAADVEEVETPRVFYLTPPAPNPARGAPRFSFDLPRAALIRLEVFDVQGRLVAVLAQGEREAGHHECIWDRTSAQGRAAGLYFVRLRTPDGNLMRRVIMLD